MYDLRTLRDQLPAIRDQLGPRGAEVAWEEIEKLLQDRRDRLSQVEALRHQLKKGSEDVARLKRAKQPADEAVAAMRALGDNIAIHEEHLRTIEAQLEEHVLGIPNVPHDTVPQGTDPSQNVEIRRWDQPPSFAFPPKSHWDIGESLGILDF